MRNMERFRDVVVVSDWEQDDMNVRNYAFLLRMYALLLISEGRLVEAEVIARDALIRAIRGSGKNSDNTTLCLKVLAQVILEQGRAREARQLIDRNLEIYRLIGARPDSYHIADARHQRGDTFFYEGDYTAALAEYQTSVQILQGDAEYDRSFYSETNYGLSILKTGRTDQAVEVLERFYRTAVQQLSKNHPETTEIGVLLAASYAAQGRDKTAGELFDLHVPALVTLGYTRRVGGKSGSVFQKRHRLLIDAYLKFISTQYQNAPDRDGDAIAARAFDYAQSLSGQKVRKSLAQSIARGAVDDSTLSDLARRQQDSEISIASLYAELTALQQEKQDEKTRKAIAIARGKLAQLEAANRTLSKTIETQYPNFAGMVSPRSVSIQELRTSLTPNEAVVAFHVASDRTYVWAFRKTGNVRFHVAKLGQVDLAAKVGLLRLALEPKPKVLGDIPTFDVRTAHALYLALLAPVADGWRSAKNLIVLADGPLAYLPFSLLVTKKTELEPEIAPLFSNYRAVPWLARSHAVTTLPSAGSLRLLRELPKLASKRPFVGFGDPLFNAEQVKSAAKPRPAVPAARVRLRGAGKDLAMVMRAAPATEELTSAEVGTLPRLPETADELRQIALSLNADPRRDVFAGVQASEARLKAMDMREVKVLAFATHGLVPGDLNGLAQPALALTPTSVSGESGASEDGLLKMDEILGLRLNADWVVLSACNTGADKSAGAEAVSGLGRAFFYAGARALLVTNWPVETNSTKLLTTTLFKLQGRDAALTRGDALRQARLRLLDGPGFVDQESGREVFAYSHPIFWAAFSLIGDGGRSN